MLLDPTVCVQTLYGHSGTVTSLVLLGEYIVSSSTDGCIKLWRQEEGRKELVYPWFELQVGRSQRVDIRGARSRTATLMAAALLA